MKKQNNEPEVLSRWQSLPSCCSTEQQTELHILSELHKPLEVENVKKLNHTAMLDLQTCKS